MTETIRDFLTADEFITMHITRPIIEVHSQKKQIYSKGGCARRVKIVRKDSCEVKRQTIHKISHFSFRVGVQQVPQ